jgi:hypothetical protein
VANDELKTSAGKGKRAIGLNVIKESNTSGAGSNAAGTLAKARSERD